MNTEEMDELEMELDGNPGEAEATEIRDPVPSVANVDTPLLPINVEDEEEEEDEVPLSHKTREIQHGKRPLNTSEALVPSPKCQLKNAPNKVNSSSAPKVTRRKPRGKGKEPSKETEASIRPFIDHLVIDAEFLSSHALA